MGLDVRYYWKNVEVRPLGCSEFCYFLGEKDLKRSFTRDCVIYGSLMSVNSV